MTQPDAPSTPPEDTRRSFIRKLAYTTPLLLTLPAAPALAQVGSGAGDSDVPDCELSPFIDCGPPPPTDEFGCRLDGEFPTFGPDGEFLGCDS